MRDKLTCLARIRDDDVHGRFVTSALLHVLCSDEINKLASNKLARKLLTNLVHDVHAINDRSEDDLSKGRRMRQVVDCSISEGTYVFAVKPARHDSADEL